MTGPAYLYVLHTNADGRETEGRSFISRELALITLGAEAGEALHFVENGRWYGSHTLKRFAIKDGRRGELLETFLVDSDSIG